MRCSTGVYNLLNILMMSFKLGTLSFLQLLIAFNRLFLSQPLNKRQALKLETSQLKYLPTPYKGHSIFLPAPHVAVQAFILLVPWCSFIHSKKVRRSPTSRKILSWILSEVIKSLQKKAKIFDRCFEIGREMECCLYNSSCFISHTDPYYFSIHV